MPQARSLAGEDFLQPITKIIAQGTSAHRQRELYGKHRDFKEVITVLQDEFWQ